MTCCSIAEAQWDGESSGPKTRIIHFGELWELPAHYGRNGDIFSTFGTKRSAARIPTGLVVGGHDRRMQPAGTRTPRNARAGVRRNSTAVRRPVGTPECRLAGGREVFTAETKLFPVQIFNPNEGQKFVGTKFCPSLKKAEEHSNSLFINALQH